MAKHFESIKNVVFFPAFWLNKSLQKKQVYTPEIYNMQI